MGTLNLTAVQNYIEENIGRFHRKRLEKIENLDLKQLLKRKNPYLFRVKHLLVAEDIVRSFTDAFISSHEETIFGDWLEGLAIFVCQQVYQGRKSGIEGIDLEFEKEGTRYIVSIKSGPNWGNSSQVKRMRENFRIAKRTLHTSGQQIPVVAVNGCCYGKAAKDFYGDYYKLCGQKFWAFISGDEDLYINLIEPLGHRAKEHNEQFHEAYARLINRMTRQFAQEFCREDGSIDWPKLVQFNSGGSPRP